MIIQTAPAGQSRLAIMMYEHTALSHQFARGFGTERFEAPQPNDLLRDQLNRCEEGWIPKKFFELLLGQCLWQR